MKQCKQKVLKRHHLKKERVQTKKRFEEHISANKKVSKVPTKNSAKHLNEIRNKNGEKIINKKKI